LNRRRAQEHQGFIVGSRARCVNSPFRPCWAAPRAAIPARTA